MTWWGYVLIFLISLAHIYFGMWHGRRIERKANQNVHQHVWEMWTVHEDKSQTRSCVVCGFHEEFIPPKEFDCSKGNHHWDKWYEVELVNTWTRKRSQGQQRNCLDCGEAKLRELLT